MYELRLRLLAPLHAGWRKVGNLQQTRPYVPGNTLWGALTARLARMRAAQTGGVANYQKAGDEIDKGLRFSYFYPVDDGAPSGNIEWPWVMKSNFDWKFLNSFTGSPVESRRQTTTEGGLHETEYIMPHTREGNPVFLQGYVAVNATSVSPSCLGEVLCLQNLFNQLQLGGERSYGWGRVAVEKCRPMDGEGVRFFGYNLQIDDSDHLYMIIPQDGFLPAHLRIQGNKDDDGPNDYIEGPIEVLNGRLTKKGDRYGRNFAGPGLFWAPGGKVKRELKLEVTRWGHLADNSLCSGDFTKKIK